MGQAKWRLNELIRENAELRIKLDHWEKTWADLDGYLDGFDSDMMDKIYELRSQIAEWEKAWDKLLHLSVVDPLFDIAVTTYVKRYDPRLQKKEIT